MTDVRNVQVWIRKGTVLVNRLSDSEFGVTVHVSLTFWIGNTRP